MPVNSCGEHAPAVLQFACSLSWLMYRVTFPASAPSIAMRLLRSNIYERALCVDTPLINSTANRRGQYEC